jgi:4-hydroxy-3-polyprenylbenzoate decarboxylase
MRIIVAITGASGIAYGTRLVEVLKKGGHETFVILSDAAKIVAKYEGIKLPREDHEESEIDAPIASGSFKVDGMIICPCSMKTLSGIANGYADNLIVRCADVMLKERRKLVLVLRETPMNAIHLENALKLARLGVQIMPASPGFYHKPKKIEDMIDFFVGKVLDQFDIKHQLFKRWKQ